MRETIFLPKPKGVKKGWIKHVGAISQNRFLVFPISEKRGITDKVFLASRETEKLVLGQDHGSNFADIYHRSKRSLLQSRTRYRKRKFILYDVILIFLQFMTSSTNKIGF